jgi:hypothetical protein
MLLTEKAENGLTQAGALLWRLDRTLPEHVLWVNPEVPLELAPTLERDRRMYAVAVKRAEQRQVMVLHPWLDENKRTTYEAYLNELEAYGLSRVMDRWRDLKRRPVHFFVIENHPNTSGEPGGVWSDYFRAGELVWICKRGEAYIVQHPDSGEEDLEKTFGIQGRTFWLEKWLNTYWETKIGFYVGVEAGEPNEPRVWAALGPQAPWSAVCAVQHLCNIVHNQAFRDVVSKIDECQALPGQYRLYLDHTSGEWHMRFRETEILLKRDRVWRYVQHLFRNPGTTFTCHQLSELYRASPTPNPGGDGTTVRGQGQRSPYVDASGIGGKQRLPSPQASIRALEKLENLKAFLELRVEEDRRSAGEAQRSDLKQKIADLLKSYPEFGQGQLEDPDEWMKRLQRLGAALDRTAKPPNVSGSRRRGTYESEDDATDRVNKCIRREINRQNRISEYLRSVLKDGHGEWTYIGTEQWEDSPSSGR